MDSIAILSDVKPALQSSGSGSQPMSAGIVAGVIVGVVVLIAALIGWIGYAYKHPVSKSGVFVRVSKTPGEGATRILVLYTCTTRENKKKKLFFEAKLDSRES